MYTKGEMAKPTIKQNVGRLGEDIAIKHLENKGFTIICLNYRKKCGEIDIIAKKREITHFIEVKSVSLHPGCEFANSETPKEFKQNTFDSHRLNLCSVAGSAEPRLGRSVTDKYRPEDNIHPTKLKRLARTIQLYLYEKHAKGVPEWQFDVITVKMDVITKQARVEFLENIII
ncbi:MAG: YraN family protein [Candidatus Paceibacterota bacterium]|jgi:Holliday junction resolvase-like predicted endonuclease